MGTLPALNGHPAAPHIACCDRCGSTKGGLTSALLPLDTADENTRHLDVHLDEPRIGTVEAELCRECCLSLEAWWQREWSRSVWAEAVR